MKKKCCCEEKPSQLPWLSKTLKSWFLKRIHHYIIDDVRKIYISMIKNGNTISVDGDDNLDTWKRLEVQAQIVDQHSQE